MSPVWITERAISAEGDDEGDVRVRRAFFKDKVTVTWFCGDTRTFTAEDLQTVIENLELFEGHPDVWVEDVDSHGHSFVARLADGQVIADSTPHEDTTRGIPWADLKAALEKALG